MGARPLVRDQSAVNKYYIFFLGRPFRRLASVMMTIVFKNVASYGRVGAVRKRQKACVAREVQVAPITRNEAGLRGFGWFRTTAKHA